jgi:flagellar hook-length control protein FliK
MNHGATLLPIDIDVEYSKNINKIYKKLNKKDHRIEKKSEERKKFKKELSSTIKKNREELKNKRTDSNIRKHKGFHSKEKIGTKIAEKQKANESKAAKTERKMKDDQDIDGSNINAQFRDTVSSVQKNNENKTDVEEGNILSEKLKSDQSKIKGKNNPFSQLKFEENTEISPKDLKAMDIKNGEALIKNKTMSDSKINEESLNIKGKNKNIIEITPDGNKLNHSQASVKLDQKKPLIDTDGAGQVEKVPVNKEKKSSLKNSDPAEDAKVNVKNNKKNSEKKFSMQNIKANEKNSIKNQSEINAHVEKEVMVEKPSSLSMVSDMAYQKIETDEILNVENLKDGKRVLNSKSISNIVKKIFFTINNKKSEVKIDLRPDVLGNIKIHISSENKHLKISIAAETNSVKEIIENSMIQLKADLQNNHMALDKYEVFVGNTFEKENSERRKSNKFEPFTISKEEDEMNIELAEPIRNESRINNIYSVNSRIDYYA